MLQIRLSNSEVAIVENALKAANTTAFGMDARIRILDRLNKIRNDQKNSQKQKPLPVDEVPGQTYIPGYE